VVTKRLGIGALGVIGNGEYRAENLRGGAAATEMPAHASSHVVFSRIRVLLEERCSGENLARRAESALQRVVLDECRLQRMRRILATDPFDGGDGLVGAGR